MSGTLEIGSRTFFFQEKAEDSSTEKRGIFFSLDKSTKHSHLQGA